MSDHQGHISTGDTVARGQVFVSAVIFYSLACDATDVTNDDNLATALLAQIQVA